MQEEGGAKNETARRNQEENDPDHSTLLPLRGGQAIMFLNPLILMRAAKDSMLSKFKMI